MRPGGRFYFSLKIVGKLEMSPKRRRGGDVPWQRKLRKSAFESRVGISTSSTGKGTFRERKWLEVASAAAAEAAAVAGNGQRLAVLRAPISQRRNACSCLWNGGVCFLQSAASSPGRRAPARSGARSGRSAPAGRPPNSSPVGLVGQGGRGWTPARRASLSSRFARPALRRPGLSASCGRRPRASSIML